jgi:ribosomal protein S18 acetylase RimI-like enzyme
VRTIRPFLNTDTPSLAQLWSEHHSSYSPLSQCPVNVWDQCILSKPFFRRENLLLSFDANRRPLGFIHFGFGSNAGGTRISDSQAIIHKICVKPHSEEGSIASELIAKALASLEEMGAVDCTALGTTDRNAFYVGISEGDNLMGVLARDIRTQHWLANAGFQPVRPTECWEVSLPSFRPPMDRLQIQVRRTCTVGRLIDEDARQWWVSSVLGHCEQVRFNLVLRTPARVEGELMFWFPDPTISGVDSQVVRLWLPAVPPTEDARERFIYLMAESLRQLQQERKQVVRTFASADQQPTVTLLQRLGFQSVEHGVIFAKALRS